MLEQFLERAIAVKAVLEGVVIPEAVDALVFFAGEGGDGEGAVGFPVGERGEDRGEVFELVGGEGFEDVDDDGEFVDVERFVDAFDFEESDFWFFAA